MIGKYPTIIVLALILSSFVVQAYEVVDADYLPTEVKVTFNTKIQAPRNYPIVMKLFGAFHEKGTCTPTGLQYEDSIPIQETEKGWQYTLDRKRLNDICSVEVYSDEGQLQYPLNYVDTGCSPTEYLPFSTSDCHTVPGPIQIEKLWWNNATGGFIYLFSGEMEGEIRLITALEEPSVAFNRVMPAEAGFVNSSISKGDNHCHEEAVVMIQTPDRSEVISSFKLPVHCTNTEELPTCDNLICEPMEKELCPAECEDKHHITSTITKKYQEIEVQVEASLYEEGCELTLQLGKAEQKQSFQRIEEASRVRLEKIFELEEWENGVYELRLQCPSSEELISTINYCNGCEIENGCLQDYQTEMDKFCFQGKMKEKRTNGEACHQGTVCQSDYCDVNKKQCMPKQTWNRFWWSIHQWFT